MLTSYKLNFYVRHNSNNKCYNTLYLFQRYFSTVYKTARWPCGVCDRGVGSNSIQGTSCQKWVRKKCSGKGSLTLAPVRSTLMNQERTRPAGDCPLGLVVYVSFRALTPLVKRRENIHPVKTCAA